MTNISNSKKKIEATSKKRLLMMKEAIGKVENFIIDDREIKRGGTSYTHETVREIQKEYSSGTKLYCIIGYDLLDSIYSWECFQDILKLSNILVTRREDSSSELSEHKIFPYLTTNQSIFHNASCGKIFIESTSIINVTSTDIKHRIKNNISIAGLVNPNLEKWLDKNKIY